MEYPALFEPAEEGVHLTERTVARRQAGQLLDQLLLPEGPGQLERRVEQRRGDGGEEVVRGRGADHLQHRPAVGVVEGEVAHHPKYAAPRVPGRCAAR